MGSYPRGISLMDSEEMWVAEHPNQLHVFRTSSSLRLEKNGFLSCAGVSLHYGFSNSTIAVRVQIQLLYYPSLRVESCLGSL